MTEEQVLTKAENSHESTVESIKNYGYMHVPAFLRIPLSPRARKFLENQGCFLTYDRILDLNCNDARFMANCGSATVEELKKFQEACRRDLEYITAHHVADDRQEVITDWTIMDLPVPCRHALKNLSMPLTVDLFGRLTDDIIKALIPKNQTAVDELKTFAAKVVSGEIQPEDLSVCQHLDDALPEGLIAGQSTCINNVLESRNVHTVRDFLTLSPSDFGAIKNSRLGMVQHHRQKLLLGSAHTHFQDAAVDNQLLWGMVGLSVPCQKALRGIVIPLSVEGIKALDNETIHSDFHKHSDNLLSELTRFVEKVKSGEIYVDSIKEDPCYAQKLPTWFISEQVPAVKKVIEARHVKTFRDYLDLRPMDFGNNRQLLTMVQQCRQSMLSGVFFETAKDKLTLCPSACSTFEEFMTKVVNMHLNSDCDKTFWGDVMKYRLGFSGKNKTLEECAKSNDHTRERIRQVENEILKVVYTTAHESYMQQFVGQVDNLFATYGSVIKCDSFIQGLENAFGWTGTTCMSVERILKALGKDIRLVDDYSIVLLNETTRARYTSFADYMRKTDVSLLDKFHKDFASTAHPAHLQDLSLEEYITFLKMMLKDDSRYLHEHTVLLGGLSQHISLALSNSLGSRTILQQEVIIRILKAAGLNGLGEEQIVQQCLEQFPQIPGDAMQWRTWNGKLFSARTAAGQRIIGCSYRGRRNGDGTRYILMSLYDTPENRGIIAEALQEISEYMTATGIGVVCLWGFWNNYKNRFTETITSETFRYLLEYMNNTGLTINYTYAIHPSIGDVDNNIQTLVKWMIYDYFHFYGKDTVSSMELSGFCVNMLKYEQSVANAMICNLPRTPRQAQMYRVAPPEGERPAVVYINDNWQSANH